MLQLLFLFAFPLLVAGSASFLTWNALSGPWKFFALCTVALYGVYAACFYLLAPDSVGYTLHVVQPGKPAGKEPLFVFLEPYYKPLATFALVAVPVVIVLLRTFRRRVMHG